MRRKNLSRSSGGATVDASFLYGQRDMFSSGLVAEIGPTAYAVWQAVKWHADYASGKSFPSVRRLAEMCGVNRETAGRCLHVLQEAKLLKWTERGRGRNYIARERMDVRIGNIVVCTVLLDYVPSQIRARADAVALAVTGNEPAEAMAELSSQEFEVEIIPGKGFKWDPVSQSLKGKLPASALPREEPKGIPPEVKERIMNLLTKKPQGNA